MVYVLKVIHTIIVKHEFYGDHFLREAYNTIKFYVLLLFAISHIANLAALIYFC